MKIIHFTTTETQIFVLYENGSMFFKPLNKPDDIWEEMELPVSSGKDKNVREKPKKPKQ